MKRSNRDEKTAYPFSLMKCSDREENCPWKDAIMDRLITIGIYSKEHEKSPMKAIMALEVWNWNAGEVMEKSRMKSLIRLANRDETIP